MKKNNKKGFTLAELLIVVAIIAVLVAIAIPVFTTQLERSREATDVANIRSAYAEIMTNYLADGVSNSTITVTAHATMDDWVTSPQPALTVQTDGSQSQYSFTKSTGTYTVGIDVDASGVVTPTVG